MKKFVIFFIVCIAMVQSTYAATPALTESLLEYDAIISAIGAPNFKVIPVNQFIIRIKRITKKINVLGKVKYLIMTSDIDDKSCKNTPVTRDKKFPCPIKYIATLNVAQNPGVGPNIVTVLKIVKVNQ